MADNFSFDIVSEVNFMELENAINQAQKELSQRFDFKGSKSTIEYKKEEKKIILVGDDDFKLRALRDILEGRMAKRGVSLKAMKLSNPENSFEGTMRQVVELVSGLPSEKAKDLSKLIRDAKFKVQTHIEGEKVRVVSAKKDELQAVIVFLKNSNFPLPLQFTNYR